MTPRRRLPFSIIAKPTGAACNLDCSYCFFLSKEALWGQTSQRMSHDTLESFIANFLDAQPDGDVTLGWQGGEPTLRGLGFFREAVDLTEQLRRPAQRVRHTIQTNGTLLDDEWGAFLAEQGFLVGLSIDGPRHLHDAYRVNKAGRGTYDQVVRGWEYLRRHEVDTNLLCTVNARNADHPLEIYRHFRDDLGARHLQFIPIVERVQTGQEQLAEDGWRDASGAYVAYRQAGTGVTSRTVLPEQYGRFLTTIFDEWVARDVGTVFVQDFDVMLSAKFGEYTLCVHAPECGNAITVEHTGDVYACDHYVEPDYRIGNVGSESLSDMLASPQQRHFGQAKRTGLPLQCIMCPVRWACHGGCPKDRFSTTSDGEPGLNYLCPAYFEFFSHASPAITQMADLISAGLPASHVMPTSRVS